MKPSRLAWVILGCVLGCSTGADAPGSGTTSAPGPGASETAAAAIPAIDPAGALGPVRIGMSRKDLDALGLPVKAGDMDLTVGPYRVVLEQGLVAMVEVELQLLPQGLRVGGTVIPATEKDIQRIAQQLPGCGAAEVRLGGNVITCAGGTVHVKAAGPPGIVMLDVASKTFGSSPPSKP